MCRQERLANLSAARTPGLTRRMSARENPANTSSDAHLMRGRYGRVMVTDAADRQTDRQTNRQTDRQVWTRGDRCGRHWNAQISSPETRGPTRVHTIESMIPKTEHIPNAGRGVMYRADRLPPKPDVGVAVRHRLAAQAQHTHRHGPIPGTVTAQSQRSHSTVTAQSQHSHSTVTAQSQHSHSAVTAQSQGTMVAAEAEAEAGASGENRGR